METFKGLIEPNHATLSYDTYLRVGDLLSLQNPRSNPKEHDETLFIIIHQTYELWFKQVLHEAELICKELKRGFLNRVLYAIKRICAIQKVLLQQLDILETMVPDDFARFRDSINPASGFQSWQFRLVEYRFGLKELGYLKFFSANEPALACLEAAAAQPSVYDEFLSYLTTRGFQFSNPAPQRDLSLPYVPSSAVVDVFEVIYRNPAKYSDIYMALEGFLDIDENFGLWRYRHILMVERMIGAHGGTGGSEGSAYLKTTLGRWFFPEIWAVRNRICGASYETPGRTTA